MVRDPVRDVVRDGLGCNPKKLRLLRKWYAMVRDLPDISRVRVPEQERVSAEEYSSTEGRERSREDRNGLVRVPPRTSLKGVAATYSFACWPTAEEAGVLDEDLLHRWEERVAICTFDGGLTEQEARRVAWEELLGAAEWPFAGLPGGSTACDRSEE